MAFFLDLSKHLQQNDPSGHQFTGDANAATPLRRIDPAQFTPGASPNYGDFVTPHVVQFSGVLSTMARIYRPSDEALQDSFENARHMRNDLVIMECIEARQRAAALLNLHVEAPDEKNGSQKMLASTLLKMMASMPRFMQYRENLLNAVFFGRYACAHRWRWKPIAGGRRIVVDRWRPIHGDKLVWKYEPENGDWDDDQVGIRVGVGYAGNTVAKRWNVEKRAQVGPTDQSMAYFLQPWERSLLAIHKHYIEDGEFEAPQYAGRIHGLGVRSRIYWTWYQKQETLAWLMEYLERSAGGFEIWFYPWGNDVAKAAVERSARERLSLGRNQVLVPKFMEGDQFGQWYDRIEPGMAGAEALKSIIVEYFGHLLKRYILGQTLTTESSGTGLGSNLADVHLATFLQIIKYDATNLEETLTTDLLEPLIRFNFPWAVGLPFRVRIDTESENSQEKLEAYSSAFNMGLKIRSQDVYDLIGATKPSIGDDVLDKSTQAGPVGSMGMGAGPGGMPGALPPGAGQSPADEGQDDLGDMLGKPADGGEHYSLREDVEAAAAATEQPSEAQIEAGNYRKGKVRLHGLEISIENARGTSRRPEWPPLSAHYGYIKRTTGRDGDHVDILIGPRPQSELVFVVDQVTKSGRFDEHKSILGTDSEAQAKRLYLANYPSGWRCGPITAMTVGQFRQWLESGDTRKPVAGQVSRYSMLWDEDKHPRDQGGEFTSSGGGGKSAVGPLPGLPKGKERKDSLFGPSTADFASAMAAAEKRGDVQYRSLPGQQSLFADEDAKVDTEVKHTLESASASGEITPEQATTGAAWVEQHGHHPAWHTMAGDLFAGPALIGRVDLLSGSYAVHVESDGNTSVYPWPGSDGKNKKKKFAGKLFPLGQGQSAGRSDSPGESRNSGGMLFSRSAMSLGV